MLFSFQTFKRDFIRFLIQSYKYQWQRQIKLDSPDRSERAHYGLSTSTIERIRMNGTHHKSVFTHVMLAHLMVHKILFARNTAVVSSDFKCGQFSIELNSIYFPSSDEISS